MANIPTIPGVSPIQTPQIGARRSARPVIQAWGGVRRVAEAANSSIDRAAEAITQFEEQKRQAKEVDAFNRASILMQQTQSGYAAEVGKSKDYSRIVDNWQPNADHVTDTIMNFPEMKGRARQVMAIQLQKWRAASTAHFQQVEDLRTSDALLANAHAAASQFYANGDVARGDKVYDNAVATQKLIYPEKVDTFKAQGHLLAARAGLERAVTLNPWQAIDDITAGKFDPAGEQAKKVALSAARTQIAHLQMDQTSQLLDSVIANPNSVDDQMLAQMTKGPRPMLTGREVAQVRAARDREEHVKWTDNYAVGMLNLQEHDFSQDDNPAKAAQELAASVKASPIQTAAFRKAVMGKLDRFKKGQQSLETPVEKQVFDLMNEQRANFGTFVPMHEETTTSGGFMGFGATTTTKPVAYSKGLNSLLSDLKSMKPEELEAAYGKGATAKSVVEAEQANYAKTYLAMRAWFQTPAGQKADYETAKAHLDSLELPHKAAAAGSLLNAAMENYNPNFSPEDLNAWHWAQAHGDDPMASQIYAKITRKYMSQPETGSGPASQ